MKVIAIDFKNKTFETDNGEVFPFVFDINENITIEEFQTIIDESEKKIKEMASING